MTDLDALLAIAMQAVDLAAHRVRTQSPGHLSPKGDRDYSSEVDLKVEQDVRSFLADATPHIGLLGEEQGRTTPETNPSWVLDPIDGTVNFAHSIPLCAVSLALVVDDQPGLGVIDLPFLGNRYSARAGGGSYRDGSMIHVVDITKLDEAVVTVGDYAVGDDADRKNHARIAVTRELASRILRLRMLGTAATDLAWLADGRTHASITLANRPWDMAAGVVIAREAGAQVLDLRGLEHSTGSEATIAVVPGLVDQLFHVLSRLRST
jgi:myo-inositol-1(or 4)-monophosphatase